MELEYLDKVHSIMQGVYGDKFILDVDTFKNKMINETQYRDKIYGIMQGVYGDKFTLDPKTFYNKVLESSKKKSQSEIGSQATQHTDGSESVQSFQGIGKAIEKNLGVKPKSDADIQAPLTEQGVKELEYRQRIKEDKDKYKIASDEQVDEAIRKNPEIVNSDKFYEGAVPEIEGIPTTLFGGNTKLESAQKQRDYYENWDPDFESAPKQTDLFSDEDVKADPKKYKDAALNDYLEYLKVKNGEDSQTYLGTKEKVDYYKSLGDKLYNDESYADDLKRFQDIQKTALSKIGNNAYAKALKIENSYDWDYFSKKASDLQLKADLIDKQIKELGVTEGKVLSSSQQKKLNDLINQYGNIQQEFSKLSEDTRIDNNVISEMSNIQNKMSKVQKSIIDIEDEDTVNAKIIKQYKEELEANKKAQEEFYNTKDSGVLETAGKGVAMFGQKAASSFVDGIFSLYNVPKIAGEALGAKGYGWTDKISEASENINSFVDLYSPQLESGNLTNFMSAMQSLGEGVGSVATFFTAGASVSRIGKALNLSQKSLNVANKAGQFAVASSLSTSQMYTEFLQNGFTPEEASRYALGAGIVMGMAEMIVPEDELIANELKGTFLSSIKSGATTKEAIENGLQFIGKKSALFAENMRKEGTEELVGQLAESASKQVSEAGSGKKIDGIWNVDDFTKAALGGAGTAGIIEIFKFGSETGEFSNPFKENMVGYLAENYNDMIKKLSESNPEAYDQIADRYGKLKEIYSGLKNIPAYNELSKADQDHVLAQAHTKQVILENIKQSGLDKANFKDQLDAIEEDIFLTLNKPKQNAVQERSTEEVLPRQQGETTETGGQPQGMGPSVQGQEVTQETEAQRKERIAKEASAGAAEVVTGLNIPNALAASVFPVVGEVEAQMEKGEFVNDEKSTEAQDKLYELLADIDSREDLTPEQKQQMSAVIENRIQKIQDYDYRTRTETRTTTQTVATGVSPKTQKQNERAAIPVRTVAEEGVDVTYDGRRGKVELRDGQYVFIPAKTGAVQGRPVVIGEAAQVNAGSRFAGVENPTKGPNAVVANITLPNGSTLSVLNDDLSVDIGLEIAKQEVGLAPQALFDTVFDEVVTENKVEVPYLRETKPAQEQAATTDQVTEQVTEQVTPQATPQVEGEKQPFTGRSNQDRSLKEKYKADNLKRKILDQAQRIASALGNNTQVYIYETTDEYNKAIAERLGEDQKESTNGRFLYGDGVSEIHIDLSKANQNTLPHEAVHAVLYKAFGENEKLFQQFKDKLKPLLANSTVSELENFSNQEIYVKQGVTAEEFLAELGGVMTAAGNRIPKTTLQKITQLLNEFLSKITGGRIAPLSTGEVIDLFNSMADAFTSGKTVDLKTSTVRKSNDGSIASRSQVGKYDALPGAPKDGPIKDLVNVAEKYAKENKINYTRQAIYVKIDEEFSKRLAVAYEEMKDDPNNPQVKKAYAELIKQTKAQYDALIKAGYEFNFYDSNTDPYDGNPMEAMRDLRNNKKMAVYGTYAGYGESGITNEDLKRNPMLASTGLKWSDQNGVLKDVTANDLFRAVHDAFGHGLEGAGFRARGEENAWQAHVRLFTGEAIKAITSETRGQNSWLNYGPYGEKNRTAKIEDTVFADQKIGLMPAWTWTENVAPAMPEIEIKSKSQINVNPQEIQKNSEAKLNEVVNGDPESGTTFNLDGTTYDGGGLVIPITSVNIDTDKISPKDISDMVEDNIDKIFDDQKVKTGIYKFTDGKQMSVDLNIIVPSEQVEFAKEFARAAGQESIFSLDTYENIKTGSTGENPVSFSAEEFLEIAEALNEGRLPNIERLEYKLEIKSKSQVSAIPKASAESKSVVSELETASNKTGLAKENAVKRFIEKYGEKGVVAKQISDNFDKIQEQLGITKICNI